MKNKGRLARRIIAVIVCMTLVLAALPTGVFSAFAQTEKGKLKVTSISDIHYFADSEKGTGDTKNGFSEAYNEWNDKGSRQHNEVDALLTAALDKAAEEGNEAAQLALDKFAYEVRKYIGAYAAALGGVDCIVFTAGVGENSGSMRASICDGLEYLGVKLDPEKNKLRGEEVVISTPDSKVTVWVIPTNEELMIAQDTAALTR